MGTLLGQDPPNCRSTKKHVVALSSHISISCAVVIVQEVEPFHVPDRLLTTIAFLKLFQFSSTIRCLGSSVTENQKLKRNLNQLQIDNVIKPKIYIAKN